MADGDREDLETRVLVLAPTARDAAATRDFLAAAGVASVACPTIADICREAARGAGAALVTAEAVLADREGQLAAVLRAQPPWSDLPLVVLTPPGADSSRLLLALEEVGPMTPIKRPVQVSALVSTVRAVLRDRRRQYAVREHLVERARSEAALRESEERLRLAQIGGGVGVWDWSREMNRTYWSESMWALYGREPSHDPAAIQDIWRDSLHPQHRDRMSARVQEFLASEECELTDEFRIVRPDGAERWLQVKARLDRDGDGQAMRMYGVNIDITERKRAEEALRKSHEQTQQVLAELQTTYDQSPVGMCQLNADLRYVRINDQLAAMNGVSAADHLGKTIHEVVPDLTPKVEADFRRIFETGEPIIGFELRGQTTADPGVEHTWLESWFPLRDTTGAIVGLNVVAQDITDRKRAEAALRASEERLRLALSAARMGTWTWDVVADAHHRDANLNALLGLPAEETVQPLAEFLTHIHPDDREAVQAAFDQSVRRGRPLNTEFRAVWPDGTVRWLRDQGDVFGIAGQTRMTGACVDVTDLKEAEAAVRRSEERLRLTLESATDHAIFTLDPDRVVTSWSPGAAVVFGYAADEIVGRSGDVVFTPEDREAGVPEKETDTARQTGRAADERWHMRKDGSRFFASGVLTLLGADARGS